MACFIVPAAEAVITSIALKTMHTEETASTTDSQETSDGALTPHIPFKKKLGWLSNMLWGGSALLAFEHLWHGEIVPWFPFLTAASNLQDTMAMLQEMATTGVTMAGMVTGIWLVIVGITSVMEKRELNLRSAAK